jgi:integration host factor subunit beta
LYNKKNKGVSFMSVPTMTRSRLITELTEAHQGGLTEKDWEKVVETIFEEITNALIKGRRVELRGFGAFSARERSPRLGRNPRTGAAVKVTSKRTPYFRAGKKLKDRVNIMPSQEKPKRIRKKVA